MGRECTDYGLACSSTAPNSTFFLSVCISICLLLLLFLKDISPNWAASTGWLRNLLLLYFSCGTDLKRSPEVSNPECRISKQHYLVFRSVFTKSLQEYLTGHFLLCFLSFFHWDSPWSTSYEGCVYSACWDERCNNKTVMSRKLSALRLCYKVLLSEVGSCPFFNHATIQVTKFRSWQSICKDLSCSCIRSVES